MNVLFDQKQLLQLLGAQLVQIGVFFTVVLGHTPDLPYNNMTVFSQKLTGNTKFYGERKF